MYSCFKYKSSLGRFSRNSSCSSNSYTCLFFSSCLQRKTAIKNKPKPQKIIFILVKKLIGIPGRVSSISYFIFRGSHFKSWSGSWLQCLHISSVASDKFGDNNNSLIIAFFTNLMNKFFIF